MKQRLSVFTSLVGINAAIYFILYIYNIGFPIIGLSGAKPISIAESYALAVGYLFGWEIGFTSIAIGGLISSYVNMAPPFYILNFIPSAVSALMIGLLKDNRIKPLTAYVILLLLYSLYPSIGVIWLYPFNIWFHILTLLIYLTAYLHYGDKNSNLMIFMYVLISTLAAQLTGSILFQTLYYYEIPLEGFKYIWIVTTYVYPVERMILTIIGYILIVGIERIFKKYNIISVLNLNT